MNAMNVVTYHYCGMKYRDVNNELASIINLGGFPDDYETISVSSLLYNT
jgi:hypothetical protein